MASDRIMSQISFYYLIADHYDSREVIEHAYG